MSEPNRKDWAWLANTYWYVLTEDLPAPELDPGSGTLSWLVDQTVWHITEYRNGYFWGVTSVVMREAGETQPKFGPGSRPIQLMLLGTVTPSGQVQITFIPNGAVGSTTTGFGQMVQVQDQWVFEMQMSTNRLRSVVAHWANMVQTREGQESWTRLPGTDFSVPEMLAGATYPTEKPQKAR